MELFAYIFYNISSEIIIYALAFTNALIILFDKNSIKLISIRQSHFLLQHDLGNSETHPARDGLRSHKFF